MIPPTQNIMDEKSLHMYIRIYMYVRTLIHMYLLYLRMYTSIYLCGDLLAAHVEMYDMYL